MAAMGLFGSFTERRKEGEMKEGPSDTWNVAFSFITKRCTLIITRPEGLRPTATTAVDRNSCYFLSTMTVSRPRKNLLLLSVVAALALLSFGPLLTYAQDAATAEIVEEEDVTDLGDVVGDAMADITEGLDDVEDLDAAPASSDESSDEEVVEAADDSSNAADETTTTATDEATTDEQTQQTEAEAEATPPPAQTGPFIDLFGEVLLSLEMVDETHAQVHQHYTNEVLSGKKVVGLYFSADW